MLYSKEICNIVIENIELLEEAPAIIEQVHEVIFKAINEKFKQFFQLKDDWTGDYTYYEEEGDEETYFLHKDWPKPEEEGDFLPFSYDFCPINEGDGYEYYLTALTGKTALDNYSICFNIDSKYCGMRKKQLNDFLQRKYLSMPELQTFNVRLSTCGASGIERLHIPICIDLKKLLEEYPVCDECLQPIDDALKNILGAHPFIDKIVQELRKK